MLDASPDGIIYRDLIPDYVKFARTIYEGSGFCFFFCTAVLLSQKLNIFLKFSEKSYFFVCFFTLPIPCR